MENDESQVKRQQEEEEEEEEKEVEKLLFSSEKRRCNCWWNIDNLPKIQACLITSHDIALERMRALQHHQEEENCCCSKAAKSLTTEEVSDGGSNNKSSDAMIMPAGLAFYLVKLLQEAYDDWIQSIVDGIVLQTTRPHPAEEKKYDDIRPYPIKSTATVTSKGEGSTSNTIVADTESTKTLLQVLQLHLSTSKLDLTLGEEMGKFGSHFILSRLIQFHPTCSLPKQPRCVRNFEDFETEEDQDAIMDIQDLACEIACLFQTTSDNAPSANSGNGSTSGNGTFPLRYAPYTTEELQSRLPLLFTIEPALASVQSSSSSLLLSSEKITKQLVLIHQVTTRQSAQDDVGFVMWPSAVILSRWLVTNPSFIENKSVLELGAGCGLCGLVAARIFLAQQEQQQLLEQQQQQNTPEHSSLQSPSDTQKTNNNNNNKRVILTDFNDIVLSNIHRNIILNGISTVSSVAKLDFYNQSGTNHNGGWIKNEVNSSKSNSNNNGENNISSEQEYQEQQHQQHYEPPVDVIIAADIICKPSDATASANTIYDALKPGGKAVVVCADSKHRFGVDIFEMECKRVGLVMDCMTNVADLYDGTLLSSSSSSSSSSSEKEGKDCNNDGSSSKSKNNMQQTCGYVDGMRLTLFMLHKPVLDVENKESDL